MSMAFVDEMIRETASWSDAPDEPGTHGLVPLEVLERELIDGAAEVNSHLAWWLGRVAEFDRREGWGAAGAKSCAHWLAWRCGIDDRTAREHVRVARALEGLALVRAAFVSGRLTYSKVRAVCRVATPDNESFLVGLAVDLTAGQLDRSVQAYANAHDTPLSLADDEARRARCGVTSYVDADGLTHTELITAPEDAAMLDLVAYIGGQQVYETNKAARACTEEESTDEWGRKLEGRKTPPGTRPGPVSRLDAFLWVLRRGLANAERPLLVDDQRHLIVIHVREGEALVGDDGRVDLGNGLVVHPRTLARLGCDGMFQTLLEGADGRPLDLGTRVRTATTKQKAALLSMYDRCAFPGCSVDVKYCQFHHLHFWSDGGRSDIENFRPVCAGHHRLIHEGGFRLVIDGAGRCVAIPPGGREPMVAAPTLPLDIAPDALVKRNNERGVYPTPAGGELGGRRGGEKLSAYALDTIVADLFAATEVDPLLSAGPPPSPN